MAEVLVDEGTRNRHGPGRRSRDECFGRGPGLGIMCLVWCKAEERVKRQSSSGAANGVHVLHLLRKSAAVDGGSER